MASSPSQNTAQPSGILRVAAVQADTGGDKLENREHVTALIREAAAQGAKFIATPEYTNLLCEDDADMLRFAEPDDDTNSDITHYKALAKELGVQLLLGSMVVATTPGRMANRSFLITPEGAVAARYDKIHLFDVDLPDGLSYRESDYFDGGHEAVVANTPFGKLGMAICYDLRFPEMFQTMARDGGAQILSVPAAYTNASGTRTWEPFLRARAAETGCFVIAPAQCSMAGDSKTFKSWGHSMVVSPWGTIIAQSGPDNRPGVVIADLDLMELTKSRESYPIYAQQHAFTLRREEAAPEAETTASAMRRTLRVAP